MIAEKVSVKLPFKKSRQLFKNYKQFCRAQHDEQRCQNEAERRIAELEAQGKWMDLGELKRLSSVPEEPSYLERLSRATQWTKVCEAAKKIGHDWQIERKYRRILTKKLAGGVRKVVRDKVKIPEKK